MTNTRGTGDLYLAAYLLTRCKLVDTVLAGKFTRFVFDDTDGDAPQAGIDFANNVTVGVGDFVQSLRNVKGLSSDLRG